ncbi:MAG: bis(5'-nucleosyl)-tetraphosphatase (symmetrical) YqeK [Tissierellia bacterium]|nr:bis(5'-nucleosyl)-tetraphosphatase (symmetrical) YqeK [Tissierellia bacterium]
MYNREEAIRFLKKHLDGWRVDHSIRVMELARAMALQWGADVENVEIAALLHDCGKWKDREAALKKLESFGIIVDGELRYDYNLVHGILGSFLVQEVFGVYEKEVLDAIRYHITGRWDMGLIEKIVYLADKLEPARDYPGVEAIRKMAEKDLDKALLMVLDDTIMYLINHHHFIAPDSIEARNFLLVEESARDGSE